MDTLIPARRWGSENPRDGKEELHGRPDYRVDRLGIKGGDQGALFVEGDVYCPATRAPLLNASVDVQEGIIDIATYRERVNARTDYQLYVKDKAKETAKAYSAAQPSA